ncbi:MAG: FecR domain-containing protein [Bacteroidota bacterium]
MQISPKLLNKYLDGECSQEEKKQVEAWLEAEKKKAFDLSDSQAEKMEARIWGNLDPIVTDGRTSRVIPLHRQVMRYAAAAIILFAAGFFTYQSLSDNLLKSDGTEQLLALKTINTARGEKRTVALPDGSTIRLNYETEISVPEQFEGDERVVYLAGHAYFDVARNPNKPFIIYTENSKTQVLGTSFDINTTKGGETEIIVTSGKVAFAEKDQETNLVTLQVNERAVMNIDKIINVSEVNARKLTAWTENILIFEDQKLGEILKVVESWFDVNVTIKNPNLLNLPFTYSDHNPSLVELMDLLSLVGKFDYTIEDREVIIYN